MYRTAVAGDKNLWRPGRITWGRLLKERPPGLSRPEMAEFALKFGKAGIADECMPVGHGSEELTWPQPRYEFWERCAIQRSSTTPKWRFVASAPLMNARTKLVTMRAKSRNVHLRDFFPGGNFPVGWQHLSPRGMAHHSARAYWPDIPILSRAISLPQTNQSGCGGACVPRPIWPAQYIRSPSSRWMINRQRCGQSFVVWVHQNTTTTLCP